MKDRGVSISVGHVLAIGITTLLITALLLAGSSFLATERERSLDASLNVEGARLAAEISQVDQVIQEANAEGGNVNVSLVVSHPQTVLGSSYDIVLTTDGECEGDSSTSISCLELAGDTKQVSLRTQIPFRNETAIRNSSVQGGPIVIRANSSAIWLEEGTR